MTRHIGGRVHRSRYADFYTTLMTIDTQTLDPKRDPMGAAILDYLTTGRVRPSCRSSIHLITGIRYLCTTFSISRCSPWKRMA